MTADTAEATTGDLLAFAMELADVADDITMRYYRAGGATEVKEKADRSLVTLADLEVEAELRRRILERFPTHSILGEEEGTHAGTEASARWIIDPVDGTNSYGRGIPIWATLIAFQRDGVSAVGVASAPALGTRWWAGRGLGAYRASLPYGGGAVGGERIHVSSIETVADAQLLYGSFRLTLNAWGGRAAELLQSAWRARGFSDFWGHCLVAEGSAEAMIEAEISPWDIAAMIVLVEEAGGVLTDLDGAPTIEAGHCITSNGHVHDDVLRRLRSG